jgi:hypothetical protein
MDITIRTEEQDMCDEEWLEDAEDAFNMFTLLFAVFAFSFPVMADL